MSSNRQRTTHQAIFTHLTARLGQDAPQLVNQVVTLYQTNQAEKAMHTFATYDEAIGGKQGVFAHFQNKIERYPIEYRPIYRPFYYVASCLESQNPQRLSRFMVHSSCLHIEGILKQCVKLTFVEKIAESMGKLPMGSMLRHRKHKKQFQQMFTQPTYDDILWLNDGVYIHGKHGFNEHLGTKWTDEEESRLFALDEALAVYLICRHLGLELLGRCGKKKA